MPPFPRGNLPARAREIITAMLADLDPSFEIADEVARDGGGTAEEPKEGARQPLKAAGPL
jgi:hypothetical protein